MREPGKTSYPQKDPSNKNKPTGVIGSQNQGFPSGRGSRLILTMAGQSQ